MTDAPRALTDWAQFGYEDALDKRPRLGGFDPTPEGRERRFHYNAGYDRGVKKRNERDSEPSPEADYGTQPPEVP